MWTYLFTTPWNYGDESYPLHGTALCKTHKYIAFTHGGESCPLHGTNLQKTHEYIAFVHGDAWDAGNKTGCDFKVGGPIYCTSKTIIGALIVILRTKKFSHFGVF